MFPAREHAGAGLSKPFKWNQSEPPKKVKIYEFTTPRYFDMGLDEGMVWLGNWANSVITPNVYVTTDGTTVSNFSPPLIPSVTGVGYSRVDGKRYMLSEVFVRGQVRVEHLEGAPRIGDDRKGRMLLVLDKQANKTQAAGGDVLQNLGDLHQTLYSFPNDFEYPGRFQILHDELIMFNVEAESVHASNMHDTAFASHQFSFGYKWDKMLEVPLSHINDDVPHVSGLPKYNVFLMLAVNKDSGIDFVFINGATRVVYYDH